LGKNGRVKNYLGNIMKSIFLLILILSTLISCSSGPEVIPLQNRWLIAVLPVKNGTNSQIPEEFSNQIQNGLISELHKLGKYRLVEREKISALLSDQKLVQLGILDESKVPEIGKILGVDAVLITDIQNYKLEKVNFVSVGSIKIQKEVAQLNLHSRLIQNQTGEILATGEAKGSVEKGGELSSSIGGFSADESKSPMHELINECVRVVSQKISKSTIPKK
jgi:curli biogenesis system outer membrane secretion channel CsgG